MLQVTAADLALTGEGDVEEYLGTLTAQLEAGYSSSAKQVRMLAREIPSILPVLLRTAAGTAAAPPAPHRG